jgi:cell division protein FtsZ
LIILKQKNMFNPPFSFQTPMHYRNIIKVIGVGGGGGNAVNHMYRRGIQDVDFIVMNTDAQALSDSPVINKLQLGINLTEGLGAGSQAANGRAAAEESTEDIRGILADNTKMVFITAGMGGGTGTGAAPVIARIARELGILTVAIVTFPFGFEGFDKKKQAIAGIEELQECCDTVLVILNDKLAEMYEDLDVDEAFEHADNILTNAAKSIAEVITKSGKINVDFNDVKTVLDKAGAAVMGSASAAGEDRAIQVITDALHSPLLNDRDINGAKRILMTVAFSSQAKMKIREQTTITNYIIEKIGHEPNALKLGFIQDEDLGEEMRITVIAAGFDLKGKDYNTRWLKFDGFEQTKETVIELNSGDATGILDTENELVAKLMPSLDAQQLIEKYKSKAPTEAELEEPAYQRLGLKLADSNSTLVDNPEIFKLYF